MNGTHFANSVPDNTTPLTFVDMVLLKDLKEFQLI